MTDELRLVLQLLTPVLLGVGLWILNSVSGRIATVEAAIRKFDEDCEERHEKMWAVIRGHGEDIARVKGRMNGLRGE